MTHLNPLGQLKAHGTWLQKEEKLMTISFKPPPFPLRLPLHLCMNHQRNHKVYKMAVYKMAVFPAVVVMALKSTNQLTLTH